MSAAQQLFDEIVAAGRTGLQRFIDDKREEDLHLDFKEFRWNAGNGWGRDHKKILAKALSGFANADGGAIVWGVEARRNDDNVDAASSLKPIPNLARMMSDLRSLTPQLATASGQEVKHEPIKHAPDSEEGYAITLVPRAEGEPVMAKGGDDRYYMRVGESFLRMEHFMIADRMRARPQPTLELRREIMKAGAGPRTRNGETLGPDRVRAVLSLCNAGRGIAAHPALKMRLSRELDGDWEKFQVPEQVEEQPLWGQSDEPPHWRLLVPRGSRVIYPGTALQLAAIQFKVGPGMPPPEVVIHCEGLCDEQQHGNRGI